MSEVIQRIEAQIKYTPVLLYMKGTPDFPMCGFSAKAANCLKETGCAFAYVNVLQDLEIRQALPQYAKWPTFPQLWVNGELIGGCDIMLEMSERGELKALLQGIEWPEN